jgi:hypothetical protein
MGEKNNTYWVLLGKTRRKETTRRPTSRWEDNIKMDLRETGRDGMAWINLAQDRD